MNTLEQPSEALSFGTSFRTDWRRKRPGTITLSPENLLLGQDRNVRRGDQAPRRPDLLECLGNLGHDVVKFSNLRDGADFVLKKLSCCLPLEHFHYYEFSPSAGQLELISHHGPKGMKRFCPPEHLSLASLHGWCFLKNYEQHYSDELRSNPRWNAIETFRKSSFERGIFLTVPGTAGPLGVLGACSAKPFPFGDDEVRFLKAVSGIISGMSLRIRLNEALHEKEREILDAQESERVRISQELHDGLCYDLMALKYKAAALEGLIKSASLQTKADLGLEEQINGILKTTRQLASRTHPGAVEARNLTTALADLAQRTRSQFNTDCSFAAEPADLKFPAPVENNLYGIAQEAVMNGIKHGEAKKICIRLRQCESAIELQIENDGTSFDLRESIHRGMGLRIMNYRARAINASVSVRTLDPQGTSVTCTLPR